MFRGIQRERGVCGCTPSGAPGSRGGSRRQRAAPWAAGSAQQRDRSSAGFPHVKMNETKCCKNGAPFLPFRSDSRVAGGPGNGGRRSCRCTYNSAWGSLPVAAGAFGARGPWRWRGWPDSAQVRAILCSVCQRPDSRGRRGGRWVLRCPAGWSQRACGPMPWGARLRGWGQARMKPVFFMMDRVHAERRCGACAK